MREKDPSIYIEHILSNIEQIETFSENLDKEELADNKLKQYAIIRAIEIIGEAVRNLPSNVKNNHPEVSWKEIIGTRDMMIHHYFGVDLNIVWNIIKIDLPILKIQIIKIKSELKH